MGDQFDAVFYEGYRHIYTKHINKLQSITYYKI